MERVSLSIQNCPWSALITFSSRELAEAPAVFSDKEMGFPGGTFEKITLK
jgi:hypothetical protein